MKKILIAIILFVSIQSFGQTKKYFERLNSNGTLDSGYVKIPAGDSVFNYAGDVFICRTKEFYEQFYNPEIPNNFSNFHLDADGIYRNYVPKAQAVDWTGIDNKPAAISNATTVGSGLMTLANPGANSLIRINADNTPVTRTLAQAKADLGIDNIDNTSDANKPVSSAQQLALNGKQSTLVSGTNIKTINGSSVLGSGDLPVSGAPVFYYGNDAGSNDSYAVTIAGISSYTPGMLITFRANTANTTGCSLNINGLGAIAIVKRSVTTPATGDIIAGMICLVVYNGNNQFTLINPVVN